MTTVEIFTALGSIGSIITPILVLVLTGIGWNVRNKIERLNELENKLREDRLNAYNFILKPFILALSSDAVFAQDKTLKGKTRTQAVAEIMLSLEYRQAATKLTLVGSDEVVRAYNAVMQHVYNGSLRDQAEPPPVQSPERVQELVKLVGELLLSIRKGVGNEATNLGRLEMLEWMITDIKEYGK